MLLSSQSEQTVRSQDDVGLLGRSDRGICPTLSNTFFQTSYEGTAESRTYKGHEGTKGDLWGSANIFKYTPGGTVTDRVKFKFSLLHFPIYQTEDVTFCQPVQVTRLHAAEDAVFKRIHGLLEEDRQTADMDLDAIRLRSTDIDYEDQSETSLEVKETADGLEVSWTRLFFNA